ncbi:MAG: GFA family protein [Acuticoccus sp.]
MSAPGERTAACTCGALGARTVGEPAVVAMCSCRMCQRRTGTAFGLYAWWPEGDVWMSGPARGFARQSERGRAFEHFFCPTCGATVALRGEHMPFMTAIAVGTFADPAFPGPTVAVWDTTRARWLDDIDGLPRLTEQRP